ncbi:MAG: glycosyltransferase family 9 protein [Thermoanaerobaculales bacterium]|nr:glycosyltransferase family 9 protein [Thermoanaerobaculales bacterium]
MRVVLVRLSALGDIVHTWPLACALAESKARLHLSWVVEEPLKILVEGHPAVDAVFTTHTGRWRRKPWAASTRSEVAAFKTRLREFQPDLVIDPQGTTKSAMVVRWSGAQRRAGLARPWRRELMPGLAYTETIEGAPGRAHVVATNLAMSRAIGIAPTELEFPDGSWLLERVADRAPTGDWSTPYAVVLPGAGGAHKVLTEGTLAEVARGLAADGLEVVVAWGPGEESRASAVVEAAGNGVYMAPPTDLGALAALLGGAALVLGGDTGPVHLAASFGSPTLAVFLASDWRRNGPLGYHTAVVSGAADAPATPSGTARTRPQRKVGAAEILESARGLLAR